MDSGIKYTIQVMWLKRGKITDTYTIAIDAVEVKILEKCYPKKTLEEAIGLIICEKGLLDSSDESSNVSKR